MGKKKWGLYVNVKEALHKHQSRISNKRVDGEDLIERRFKILKKEEKRKETVNSIVTCKPT